MGTKADARAERQRENAEKFAREKARLLAQIVPEPQPKVAQLPALEQMALHPGVDPAELVVPEQPRTRESGSRLHLHVTWCVRKRDITDSWSWGEVRQWSSAEWSGTIGPAFANFERLTWGELQKLTSDTQHLMHHDQELSSICSEAQQRWLDIGLEQFDTLFRLRMGNTLRFWGFVLQGHFFGVWWEREHRISPVA